MNDLESNSVLDSVSSSVISLAKIIFYASIFTHFFRPLPPNWNLLLLLNIVWKYSTKPFFGRINFCIYQCFLKNLEHFSIEQFKLIWSNEGPRIRHCLYSKRSQKIIRSTKLLLLQEQSSLSDVKWKIKDIFKMNESINDDDDIYIRVPGEQINLLCRVNDPVGLYS